MKQYLIFSKRNLFIWGGIILLLIIIGYFTFFRHTSTYQFVTVATGPITETVSLTGNTTPNQSVSLSFGGNGIIAHTYSALGKVVQAGQVLAELDTSDLLAQLHNAEAGLTIAEQQASASTNNVANVTAEQDTLVHTAYQNLLNSTPEAVPKNNANDYTAPIISGNYILGKEGTINLHYYASTGGMSFTVSGLTNGSGMSNSITSQPIGDSGLYIKFPVGATLGDYDWVINIPNTKAANYLSNYNAYQLALQTRDKVIADATASVGTTDPSSVSNAEIAQAQASIDSINAKIKDGKIIAPISGTVTQFDAKIGQLASPGSALISIISSSGYEVDAGVSETDVGKVLVGDKVSMTLDAFPNETFNGSVFYIAPAETNMGGVISYQVKISFDKIDPRLKSGLTANIDIETKHKDNVLILPQYAILQNDQGTFVETLDSNNKIKQNPVTLGIVDQNGNVEVVSGVTGGEQVQNIGLKATQ
jgi:HlyD family secretion protein